MNSEKLEENSKKFSKFMKVLLETEGSGNLKNDNKNLAKLSGCSVQEVEKYKEILLTNLKKHKSEK